MLNWQPRIPALAGLLHRAFRELAGTDPAASVYLEQYARGRISSGMTSLDTWRERLTLMPAERARTRLPSRPQQTDPDHKPPSTSVGTLATQLF